MQLELFKDSSPRNKITNISSVPHRSPFRYPGGKTWFVPTFRKWMASKKTKPKILLEPFAGGGIIGLTAAFENMVDKVILVELDENIAAVWSVILSKDNERLASQIENYELEIDSVRKLLDTKPNSTYKMAFQTIVRNRVSHGGIMAPGSGLIKEGENGKGISSRWYPSTIAKRIKNIGQISHKVKFIHGSGLDIIPEFTNTKMHSIFVDPPYTAGGKKAGRRLYFHHSLDHKYLFKLFSESRSDFLFTYDLSNELISLAQQHGYLTEVIAMKNTHHAKMTELIVAKDLSWLMNP